MADEKKRKLEKFTTPIGVAVYPKLNIPDTKYKPEGVFTIRLRLSAEDSLPLIEKIDALAEARLNEEKAALIKAGKKAAATKVKMAADKPYRATLDEEGEETGDFEFNFKMNHQVTFDGKTKLLFPKLFDSKGEKFPDDVQIWGGSKVKVAGQFNPFYTAAIGAGVSLRLSAVKVIDLVTSDGGNAESYGFGDDEDGYTAPAKGAAGADGSDDTTDEEEDF